MSTNGWPRGRHRNSSLAPRILSSPQVSNYSLAHEIRRKKRVPRKMTLFKDTKAPHQNRHEQHAKQTPRQTVDRASTWTARFASNNRPFSPALARSGSRDVQTGPRPPRGGAALAASQAAIVEEEAPTLSPGLESFSGEVISRGHQEPREQPLTSSGTHGYELGL